MSHRTFLYPGTVSTMRSQWEISKTTFVCAQNSYCFVISFISSCGRTERKNVFINVSSLNIIQSLFINLDCGKKNVYIVAYIHVHVGSMSSCKVSNLFHKHLVLLVFLLVKKIYLIIYVGYIFFQLREKLIMSGAL